MTSTQKIHGFVMLHADGGKPRGFAGRLAARFADHGQRLAAEYLGKRTGPFSESLSDSLTPSKKPIEKPLLPSDGYNRRFLPSFPGHIIVSGLEPEAECFFLAGTTELSRSLDYIFDLQLDGELGLDEVLGALNVLRTASLTGLAAGLEPFGIEVRGLKGMPYTFWQLYGRLGYDPFEVWRDHSLLSAVSEGKSVAASDLTALLKKIESADSDPVFAANLCRNWEQRFLYLAAQYRGHFLDQDVHLSELRRTAFRLIEPNLNAEMWKGLWKTSPALQPLLVKHPLFDSPQMRYWALNNADLTALEVLIRAPLSDNENFLLYVFTVCFDEIRRLEGKKTDIAPDNELNLVRIIDLLALMAGLKSAPFQLLADLGYKDIQLALAANPEADEVTLSELISWAERKTCTCLMTALANHPKMAYRKDELTRLLFDEAQEDEVNPGDDGQ